MHIFHSKRDQKQMASNTTNPMQLIRTRSASDRFPAFSKAASRSQASIESQRMFNRSMSAQEAEKETGMEESRRRADHTPILYPTMQDDKENFSDADNYPSELSWVRESSQASNVPSSTLTTRPLYHVRSMNNLTSKTNILNREEFKKNSQRSPLRERRQKAPLTIKAPAAPSFTRPRAKSSASFGTILSPPPCPPPSTPLPELPPSCASTTINTLKKEDDDKSTACEQIASIPPILNETPFEQAWRSNHELMNCKLGSKYVSLSSTSSSSSPSPVSSEGDQSADVILPQLYQHNHISQVAQCNTKVDNQEDVFSRKFGLSSLVDQLNWDYTGRPFPQGLQSREDDTCDDNCVYGLAM